MKLQVVPDLFPSTRREYPGGPFVVSWECTVKPQRVEWLPCTHRRRNGGEEERVIRGVVCVRFVTSTSRCTSPFSPLFTPPPLRAPLPYLPPTQIAIHLGQNLGHEIRWQFLLKLGHRIESESTLLLVAMPVRTHVQVERADVFRDPTARQDLGSVGAERSLRVRPRCSSMRTLRRMTRVVVPAVRLAATIHLRLLSLLLFTLLLSLLLLLAHAPSPALATPFHCSGSEDSCDEMTMATRPLALCWETLKHHGPGRDIDMYLTYSNQSTHNLTATGDCRAEWQIGMYVWERRMRE